MIRTFLNSDTDRVMQIWLGANIEAHAFIPREYWEANAPAVREQLLQARIYVYEKDGVIQGFVGMQTDYLAGIFVDQSVRSMGIGKQLLSHVKTLYPAFSLNVYQKNERAVAFYLREGLTISAEGLEEDTGNLEYTMTWRKP